MAQKVLIADDDQVVHEALGIYLKAEGFEVVDAFDGVSAIESITPEVVLCVLDIMMPKMSGIEVCREIRKTSQLPILMLTAKGEEIDRIVGLELGADDYIVKPFSPREVVARIKAVLRRASEQPKSDTSVITYNGLTIDLKSYTVTLRNQPVICTPKEIEILHMLASNPGQVFTREQLLSRVWVMTSRAKPERWIRTSSASVPSWIPPALAGASRPSTVSAISLRPSKPIS